MMGTLHRRDLLWSGVIVIVAVQSWIIRQLYTQAKTLHHQLAQAEQHVDIQRQIAFIASDKDNEEGKDVDEDEPRPGQYL